MTVRAPQRAPRGFWPPLEIGRRFTLCTGNSTTTSRPSKPHPDFPHFPHATVRWAAAYSLGVTSMSVPNEPSALDGSSGFDWLYLSPSAGTCGRGAVSALRFLSPPSRAAHFLGWLPVTVRFCELSECRWQEGNKNSVDANRSPFCGRARFRSSSTDSVLEIDKGRTFGAGWCLIAGEKCPVPANNRQSSPCQGNVALCQEYRPADRSTLPVFS